MNKSKVCIMLSTYNGVKYIDEQMESLLAQHEVDVQINIRDDGSSDGTVQKLNEYAQSHPDKIRVIEGENLGVIGSFFELMCQTEPVYDYYAFCDQDDVWKSNKLIKAVTKLLLRQSNNVPLMYCSSTQMVDQDLSTLDVWPALPPKPLSMYNAIVENCCVGCTMVLNPIAFEQIRGNVPIDLKPIIMHDRWIYLYVSAFGEVIFDEEPMILYRQHQGNVLGGSSEGWLMQWKNRLKRFFSEGNLRLSKQASLFLETYKDHLSAQQLKDIQQFLNQLDSPWIKRIKYASQMPFYRHASLDNLILKLIYILKKV